MSTFLIHSLKRDWIGWSVTWNCIKLVLWCTPSPLMRAAFKETGTDALMWLHGFCICWWCRGKPCVSTAAANAMMFYIYFCFCCTNQRNLQRKLFRIKVTFYSLHNRYKHGTERSTSAIHKSGASGEREIRATLILEPVLTEHCSRLPVKWVHGMGDSKGA